MSEVSRTILSVFLIALIGLLIGRIRIKGISFGISAVFFVGLLFGHFGVQLPSVLQSLGLVLFITSVGLSAGQGFWQVLRRSGIAYTVICILTVGIGAILCLGLMDLWDMDASLAVGMLAGAFTSSTSYAAAKDVVAASPAAVSAMAAGYGVTYPIGLICKVLFVQTVFKRGCRRGRVEETAADEAIPEKGGTYCRLDPHGLIPLSAAVAAGLLLGNLTIPLPGGIQFTLGQTGGPLLVGLAIGQLGHLGPIDLTLSPAAEHVIKQLGLLLFFSGAGTEGGRAFAEILGQWGMALLFGGLLLVMLPLGIGYFLARKAFGFPLLNSLALMSASMTSTPSLALLMDISGKKNIAFIYAAVYPISLLLMVVVLQLLLR